jgi:hypothetical protein
VARARGVGGDVDLAVASLYVLMMIRSLLALVIAVAIPLSADAQTPRDTVIAVVNEFFRAMTARDTATLARVQVPGAMHYSVRKLDTLQYFERSARTWLQGFATSRDTFVERMWNPTVLVHGPLASLWAPYDIYRNGKFVHCGVDAFTLIRTKVGWQITSVAYTMEPTGCAPSPLGPLRAP